VLFSGSEIPKMETPERVSGVLAIMKDKRLWLSVVAIFLGGAAECTMAQWASGYIEKALGIEKVWGDIFGVALFAMMLGLGRTMYANKGKNIGSVLFFGAIGAAVCYFIAAVSNVPIVGLLACGLTGFCVSMLWPGNLIVATDRLPNTGVFMFAMMAAGGDLGASVGPQLVGVVTDVAMASGWGVELAATLSMSVEALGMKLGMLVGMIFPLIAIFIYYVFYKEERKKKAKEQEEQLKGDEK
jgi:fucose permease